VRQARAIEAIVPELVGAIGATAIGLFLGFASRRGRKELLARVDGGAAQK
jgi:hypothetical protein